MPNYLKRIIFIWHKTIFEYQGIILLQYPKPMV